MLTSDLMWTELASRLLPLDLYVLSLGCRAWRCHYLKNALPFASFDLAELAERNAWSILGFLNGCQLRVLGSLRVKEYCGNREIRTTAPDWAARKGHLQLLQWLLHNTDEGCTTYAMDFAARNGHFDVLVWLHRNRAEGCTNAAADWAAFKGHLHILQWLYENTASRCSDLATSRAAARGDSGTLEWLVSRGVWCSPSAANFAFANGQAGVLEMLQTMGCMHTVRDRDTDVLQRMRDIVVSWNDPFERWD